MASTRFPGKPLAELCGKPMVQWVFEAAVQSGVGDRVIIATPDVEIAEACRAFGAESALTRGDHPSGTDRLAEVAQTQEADVYINLQGDEPLIPPLSIAACAAPLLDDPGVQMSSVYSDCAESELDDPSVVKVVLDQEGYALYFSRYPVPYPRNARTEPVRKHVGIYGFRREALAAFSTWSQTPLEQAESLEQLRFLEHGIRIKMAYGAGTEMAVDTPEQAEQVRRILALRSAT